LRPSRNRASKTAKINKTIKTGNNLFFIGHILLVGRF
jgi:hypothetical protein